eukprot:PhM_4_TR5487/c0_g1_i1/m.55124
MSVHSHPWLDEFNYFLEHGEWSSAPWRKQLMQQAHDLLQHAQVRRTPLDTRVKFLLSRGLTLAEVEAVLEGGAVPLHELETFLLTYDVEVVSSDTEEVLAARRKAVPKPPEEKPLWHIGMPLYACEVPSEGKYFPVKLEDIAAEREGDPYRVTFMKPDGTFGQPRYLTRGFKGVVADVFPEMEVLAAGLEVIAAVPDARRGHFEEFLITAVNDASQTVDLEPLREDGVAMTGVSVTDVRTFEHPADMRADLEKRKRNASMARLRDRVHSMSVFPVKGVRARSASISEMTGSKALTEVEVTSATMAERREMANQITTYERYANLARDSSPEFMCTYKNFVDRYGEGTTTPKQMVVYPPCQLEQRSVGYGFDLSCIAHHRHHRPLINHNPILEIATQCCATNTMFVDADFPPTVFSLTGAEEPMPDDLKHVQWRRASEILHRPYVSAVGQKMFSVRPGFLTPSWFPPVVSYFTQLPEFEEAVSPLEGGHTYGAYVIRLFCDSAWYYVVVDDFFPWDTQSEQFACCTGTKLELYPMLLEKAFAKLFGSYAALSGRRAHPARSLCHAWDDMTSGYTEKVHLPLLPPRSDMCSNLYFAVERDHASCSVVACVTSKCTTPQKSMLNAMGLSPLDHCVVTKCVKLNKETYFWVSNPWSPLPPCPEESQLRLIKCGAEILEMLQASVADSDLKHGVWFTFPLLREFFESLYFFRNVSSTHKAAVEASFAGYSGSSIFDLEADFASNPQFYVALSQPGNVTFEFRLRRHKRGPELDEPRHGRRMHMHVFPAQGYEKPLTPGQRPDDAHSSPLADLVDDIETNAYPVVAMRCNLNMGGYLVVPDVGAVDSDEQFVLRVMAENGFSVRLLR